MLQLQNILRSKRTETRQQQQQQNTFVLINTAQKIKIGERAHKKKETQFGGSIFVVGVI